MPKDRKRKRDEVGRPEAGVGAAVDHYIEPEAQRYTVQNPKIQREMTQVALELCCAKPGNKFLILDAGCGSGLSAEVVHEDGHTVVGLDTTAEMLGLAPASCKGMLAQADLGQGIPLRHGIFDAVISISAIQWLLQSPEDSRPGLRFFQDLRAVLKPDASFACQVYPASSNDADRLVSFAENFFPKAGFVAAAPHGNKSLKLFLVSSCTREVCPAVWPRRAACCPSEAMTDLHRRYLRRVEGAIAVMDKNIQSQENAGTPAAPTSSIVHVNGQEIIAHLLTGYQAIGSDNRVAEIVRSDPLRALVVARAELARCKALPCFKAVVFRCDICDIEVPNAELLAGHMKGKKHREKAGTSPAP